VFFRVVKRTRSRPHCPPSLYFQTFRLPSFSFAPTTFNSYNLQTYRDVSAITDRRVPPRGREYPLDLPETIDVDAIVGVDEVVLDEGTGASILPVGEVGLSEDVGEVEEVGSTQVRRNAKQAARIRPMREFQLSRKVDLCRKKRETVPPTSTPKRWVR